MYDGTDHYAVLGLNPSADEVVVHAAWKALLRKHHPDTNPDKQSGARAREINEAFAVLGKPDARARYDRARNLRPDFVAAMRHPAPVHDRAPYRAPPRRRPLATRLFGAALLIVAAFPFAITALLALPATGPSTHDALLSFSVGSPFAEDLVSRLDAVAKGFTADPVPPAATSIDSDTNKDGGVVAAGN